MKILKYLIILALCFSVYGAYVTDGRLIFSKDTAAKDRYAYLCIARDGAIDTFGIIDTMGYVTWIGEVLIPRLWVDDTLFITDGGADTNYITNTGVYLEFGGDNNLNFAKSAYFTTITTNSFLNGSDDARDIRWDGWKWYLDYDGDDSLAFIRYHSTDSLKADTISHELEWTGVGGMKTDHITCVVSDTIASAATLTLTNYNNFVVSGTADIDSFDAAGVIANWKVFYIEFTGTAAANGLIDGKNVHIAGNFAYNPDDIITLQRRGNIFYEISRSAN